MTIRKKAASPIQPIFDAMNEHAFGSIEEVQAWMDRRMRAYNDEGQKDLGGLSPGQMGRLLDTDWSDISVTRLARDLTLDDVAHSAWFQGARALLRVTGARGGLPLPKGVAEEPNIDWMPEVFAATRGLGLDGGAPVAGPVDAVEALAADVLGLALAGGLLRPSGGKLVASKRSIALTQDKAAGEFYRQLFRAWARDLDIVELYELPEVLEPLVTTLPFTVYRVQAETERWRSADWLAKHAMHPDIAPLFAELHALPVETRTVPLAIVALQPLVQLGLLDLRAAPRAKVPDYRRTPLFTRALSFDFTAPADVRRPRR